MNHTSDKVRRPIRAVRRQTSQNVQTTERSPFSPAPAARLAQSIESVLESLEGRQLLSGTPVQAGNIITLQATGNDTILVSHDAVNAALLDVNVDGTVTQFSAGSVSQVRVSLGGGNNLVGIDNSNGIVWQHLVTASTTGNDTIYGGQNSDWIFGGSGKLTAYGNGGGDYVDGGSGTSTIYDTPGTLVFNGSLVASWQQYTPPSPSQTTGSTTGTTPSATPPTPVLSNYIITLQGDGSDTITISHDATNPLLLDINVDGTITQFFSGAVSQVRVALGSGNNLVAIDNSNGIVWQHLVTASTTGNDTIYGGENSDWIFGGSGNLTVYGNGGGDYVDGGTGASTITDTPGTLVFNASLVASWQQYIPPSGAQTTTTTPAPTPTTTTTTPSTSAAGFFPVGIWLQPTSLFDTWKAAGINTLVGYTNEGNVTIPQWDTAAKALGLDYIRAPQTSLAADVGDPNLLAWLAPTDEPDASGVSPATLLAQYQQYKAADGSLPVLTNYDGSYVMDMQGTLTAADYTSYTAATDWVSSDIYPVTGWGLPNQLNLVGQTVSKLSADSGGKRQFAFIEAANANLPWVANDQAPTANQMQGEIWDAVIHGATGITYFPQQIGGTFEDDATPPALISEMTTQNALLQQFGGALLSQSNPTTVGFNAASPLEATWRVYNGKTYYFVLNLSNQAVYQPVTLTGVPQDGTVTVGNQARSVTMQNGTFTDYFAPDGINVYVVG